MAMNNKLISRAATAYHKMLTKIATANTSNKSFSHHICNIKNIMAEISVWSKRLEVAQIKGWKSATSFLKQIMIKNLVQNAANNFSVMENELLEENEISVPTIKELWQEIKSLNGLFENCEFRNNRLSVNTKPIILVDNGEEFKFGRFKISIDFKTDVTKSSYEHIVFMEALEPNPASSEENLVHPHVRGDEPCLGEAAGLIQKPFVEGRIESVFLVLNSMLKTYNPDSPYVALEEWYDEGCSCSECGESLGEDDVCCCEKCGTDLCGTCCTRCAQCENYCCVNCLGYTCSCCEECVCVGCDYNECEGCGTSLCNNCTSGCCTTYCKECLPVCECGSSFCSDCEGAECTICNKGHCGDCMLVCEGCDANTCPKCGNECATCGNPICPKCTQDCENCDKQFCKNCIDEDECSLLKEKVK